MQGDVRGGEDVRPGGGRSGFLGGDAVDRDASASILRHHRFAFVQMCLCYLDYVDDYRYCCYEKAEFNSSKHARTPLGILIVATLAFTVVINGLRAPRGCGGGCGQRPPGRRRRCPRVQPRRRQSSVRWRGRFRVERAEFELFSRRARKGRVPTLPQGQLPCFGGLCFVLGASLSVFRASQTECCALPRGYFHYPARCGFARRNPE